MRELFENFFVLISGRIKFSEKLKNEIEFSFLLRPKMRQYTFIYVHPAIRSNSRTDATPWSVRVLFSLCKMYVIILKEKGGLWSFPHWGSPPKKKSCYLIEIKSLLVIEFSSMHFVVTLPSRHHYQLFYICNPVDIRGTMQICKYLRSFRKKTEPYKGKKRKMK